MRDHGLRGPCRLSFETQAQSSSQLSWLPSEKEILIESYAHGPKRFNLSPTTCQPQVRDTEPSPFLPVAVVRRRARVGEGSCDEAPERSEFVFQLLR